MKTKYRVNLSNRTGSSGYSCTVEAESLKEAVKLALENVANNLPTEVGTWTVNEIEEDFI